MVLETMGLDERQPRKERGVKSEPKNDPRGVPTFQDQVGKELLCKKLGEYNVTENKKRVMMKSQMLPLQ